MDRTNAMTLGQHIRYGAAWIMVGTVGQRGLEFLFGVVLARLLAPQDFGYLVTVNIFTGLIGQFATGGMARAIVQAKDLDEVHHQTVFTLQFITCAAVFVAFMVLAPLFSIWYHNDLYSILFRVSSVNFLLRPFSAVPSALLRRQMKYKAASVIQFVTTAAGNMIAVGMAFYGFGVWSLIISGLASIALINIPLLAIAAHWRPRFRVDRGAIDSLGSYGMKSLLIQMLTYAKAQAGNFIISRNMNPLSIGLYNKADSLGQLPTQIISQSVAQSLFRGLSIVQTDLGKSRYLFFRSIGLLALYTLPFLVCLWWFAEPLVSFVYGEQWRGTGAALKILSLAGVSRCIGAAADIAVESQKRLGQLIRVEIETLILFSATCAFAVSFGIKGVAWAVVLDSLYTSHRMFFVAIKAIGGRYADLLRALAPCAVLGGIMIVVMEVADLAFVNWMELAQYNMAHVAIVGGGGVLAYGMGFLFLPLSEIEVESSKWKAVAAGCIHRLAAR